MKNYALLFLMASSLLVSCSNNDSNTNSIDDLVNENPAAFNEIASITIGGAGAAEISSYDEVSKKLFTVNNSGTNRIDVIDLSDPTNPKIIGQIDLTRFNGASNSVATHNGKLAVALEASPNKQALGKVVVFDTADYRVIKEITVGSLPDMVVFSPDGKYIMTANEGEPSSDYAVDPEGSISIIEVTNNYAVTTLNFSSFSNQLPALKANGFKISSPSNDFAKDIEPEYITISADSKTAWVTLQENNGVAKVDLLSKKITSVFALGLKDYNNVANGIDISDKDGSIAFNPWNVKGMYMPDAISNFEVNGTTYFVTANEGDAREYDNYVDVSRIGSSSVVLDPTRFPDAVTIKKDAKMGRLNIVNKMGDTDGDGDIDELVSFGGRSFSIWNGTTGSMVFDSKNDLDSKAFAFGTYDDNRSDDKGAEPESVITVKMGNKNILFVGLERTDNCMIYDVTNPSSPIYLQTLKTGDAPEGLLFIPASKSPTKRSLLVVSSEGDGTVKIYQPNLN
ncbi:choice-of-anchor I family protein [Flavobacterium sp. F-380]|uniref:Choice-of-anchor I family protein n=1 Tax=Flavobacterium kayseriense TaxID=2764714 RepID=A0ABR7JA73_9FLAO|nr:choice-of-anchor I family protein [Flavobacterium kayseriense]MBC5842445.1 choice-of-anchor I family protein [Flavobacterium kayseriense]MBC5848975.1 choice-of-anchor I family protein [Flavobacterium kayseriense]